MEQSTSTLYPPFQNLIYVFHSKWKDELPLLENNNISFIKL